MLSGETNRLLIIDKDGIDLYEKGALMVSGKGDTIFFKAPGVGLQNKKKVHLDAKQLHMFVNGMPKSHTLMEPHK